MDGQRIGGSKHLKPRFWSGLLHYRFPTCRDCPQYGQVILYERKCYYERMCFLPVFIQVWRLKRILRRRAET